MDLHGLPDDRIEYTLSEGLYQRELNEFTIMKRKKQVQCEVEVFSLGVHSGCGAAAEVACAICLCLQTGLVQAQCQELVADVLLQLVLAGPKDAELFVGLVQCAMEKTLYPINHLHFL